MARCTTPDVSILSPRVGVQIASVCLGMLLPWAGTAYAGEQPRFTIESTTDVASYGSLYVDSTVTVAPFASLYESGLRLRFTSSYNQYDLTKPNRTSSNKTGEALMGYVFALDRMSIMLGAGAVLTNKAESGQSETRGGGKVVMSVYARPTDATMFFGQMSYSSATQFRLAQGKFGWQVMPKIYVGPEASVFGGTDFTQARLGAHVTGFSLWKLNGGISAGVLRDSNNGNGLYSSLSLQMDM